MLDYRQFVHSIYSLKPWPKILKKTIKLHCIVHLRGPEKTYLISQYPNEHEPDFASIAVKVEYK